MAACFNCSSSSSPDQQRQNPQLPNSLLTFPTTSLYNSHSAAINTTSNSMINGHGGDNHLLSSQHSLPSVPSLHKTTSFSNYSSKTTTTTSSLISSTCLPGSSSSAIHSLAVFNHRLFAGTPSSALVFPNIPKDLTSSTQLFSLPSSGAVKSFSFAAGATNGKFLIFTGHQDGRIRAWEYSSQSGRYHQFATLPTPGDRLIRSVVPGSRVPVRRHKKRLWIDHVDTVSAVAVAGELLYSASWDRTIKVWRLSDLRCIESIRAHDDAVNSIVVSVNGLVYTGSADTRIRVWSKSKSPKPKCNVTHSLLATLEKHRSAVNALALNRDGSVLYSGACDRSILVWIKDTNNRGENIQTRPHMTVCGALRGHKQAILSLVSVSDLLFSGSADLMIRVWSREIDNQYCPLLVLEGHEKPVKALAACQSGSDPNQICLYSGSLDGEIRSWQIRISINC